MLTFALDASTPADATINVTVSPLQVSTPASPVLIITGHYVPLSITHSLQWFCSDNEWNDVPLALDTCSWEGAGINAAYASEMTLAPGAERVLRLDPGTNATLYPATWYDAPSLYVRVVGPPLGALPVAFSVRAIVGDDRAFGERVRWSAVTREPHTSPHQCTQNHPRPHVRAHAHIAPTKTHPPRPTQRPRPRLRRWAPPPTRPRLPVSPPASSMKPRGSSCSATRRLCNWPRTRTHCALRAQTRICCGTHVRNRRTISSVQVPIVSRVPRHRVDARVSL